MSKTLSRAVDHLGFIRQILRELAGYGTLAFELIQNADDTGCASLMRFDIRDEALWVEDNDRRIRADLLSPGQCGEEPRQEGHRPARG